jgi:hypothetical protein
MSSEGLSSSYNVFMATAEREAVLRMLYHLLAFTSESCGDHFEIP